MTSTSEERREVANKLRERTKHKLSKGESMQHMFSETLGVYRTYDYGAFGLVKESETWKNIVNLLADLIDRPTCHISETDHEFEDSVRCDRCRTKFNRPWEPFRYCPNCGAEVIDA